MSRFVATYNPKAIANYFLEKAEADGKKVTPLKIIKLVYLAHGWKLAFTDEPLIDEPIEAWKFGPVIPSLYREFKGFGNEQITRKATEFDLEDFELIEPVLKKKDEVKPLLDRVWTVYGGLNGIQLSNLTHQSGSPWDVVWNKRGGKDRRGVVIPDPVIKAHFTEQREANARRRATE